LSIAGHTAVFASASTQDAAGPTPAGGSDASEVCIPNISRREGRKRLIAGVIQFAISLAVLAVLIVLGADRWWRLPLFVMFWGAAGGFFQWRDKT
jgi:fatty acid desaturase